MKKTLIGTTSIIALMLMLNGPALAGKTKEAEEKYAQQQKEIQELRERLMKLEQDVSDSQIDSGNRLTKIEQTQDAVQWSFVDLRPSVRSGDGRFELAFRGRFMFDMASFDQEQSDFGVAYNCAGGNALCDQGSGGVFRRMRFGVEGKFFRDFIFEIRFDFGGSGSESPGAINIARVGYTGIPGLRVHLGALQPIMTMYDATSSAELTTMERAAVVTTLVGNFGGDNARRGIEATYQSENFLWDGDNFVISAAYTGERVGSDHTGVIGNDESTYLLGRLAYRLYGDGTNNVQIGGTAAQVLNQDDGVMRLRERPEIRLTGDRYIDTGNITVEDGSLAYGFEFGANFENLYLAGEYYEMELNRIGANPDPVFSGWYVEGEWIFTGENKRYVAGGTNNNVGVFRGPSIASPFSGSGGTGAWSLHARHSVLDLNYREGAAGFATPTGGIRGGEQAITNIGLTWYLNSNFKLMGEYSMVDIDRLSGTGTSLNADFDIIQARAMFTF